MPTLAYALTTLDRVKMRLSNVPSDWDSLFESLINEVTDFIEGQCGRRFGKTTYPNEIYNGYNTNEQLRTKLFVKNYPIKTITSFQYKTATNPDVWANFSATDYIVDYANGIIRMVNGYLPGGWGNIRLTYDAGYVIDWKTAANHELPFDLTMAANRMVIKEFKRKESAGRSSESIGGDNISWIEDIDADILRVINKYQKLDFSE
jgi:hypothetical protein